MDFENFFKLAAPEDAARIIKTLNDAFDKAPPNIAKALREFFDLISEMSIESDRGTVILAAAQVDELLERLRCKNPAYVSFGFS